MAPAQFGHRSGVKSIKRLVESSLALKIQYITIYAFSTENWRRPKSEVKDLMGLLQDYLENDIADLIKYGVKIVISGDISVLDAVIQEKVSVAQEETKDNSGPSR